jgi:predicted TPR repeat methyltransferase
MTGNQARSDGPNASAAIAPSIAPSLWNVGWIGVRVHEMTEQAIAVAAEAVQHFDELAANEPGYPAAAVKIRVHGSAAIRTGRAASQGGCR